jgi:hypothetical protein
MDQNQTESSVGPIIGTIIIVTILVLGGIYYWSNRLAGTEPQLEVTQATSTTKTDPLIDRLSTQSSSDDLQSINQDLKATNLSDINAGLNDPNISPQ